MIRKKQSKRSLSNNAIILLALSLLFSQGCGNQEVALLSENSIIYCSEGAPETFNPQLTHDSTSIDATSKQFYSTLVSLPANSSIVEPALAKSWHITRDGLKLTFYLRRNVTFHSTDYFSPTRYFNADDVIFTFNRVLDAEHSYHQTSGGEYPFFDKVHFKQVVDNIEKINDYTVRFNLKRADSSLLSNLATDFAVILSQEYAELLSLTDKAAQLDNKPIGTGPFKLKDYRIGSYIRYQPHESYWGEKAAIKQLIFDITPSNTGRLTKLLAGECDVVNNPIAHENIEQRPDLMLSAVTSFNVNYLALNTQKAPLDDMLVRQALHHTINKNNIVDTLFFTKAAPATAMIPPNSWAFPKDYQGTAFSKLTAIEKLISKGYTQGFAISMLVKTDQGDYDQDVVTMAEMLAQNMQAAGVKVEVVIEHSAKHQALNKTDNQFDMVLNSWTSEHSDPNNFFTPLLSCSAIEQGTNQSQWCNESYDQLIGSALTTQDLAKRKQYYAQALKLVNEQTPLIPVSHSKQYLAQSKSISGEMFTAFGGINFQSVSKN